MLSEQQAGVSNARNVGIDHAKAPWLCFIDADDRLKPNHLQTLFDATKTGQPDIVIGGHIDYRAINNTYRETRLCEKEERIDRKGIAELPSFVRSIVWAKLCNTTFIRHHQLRFDTTFTFGEDTLFMYECLLNAEHIKLIPACTYIYTFPEPMTGKSAASKFHPCMEEMRIKEKDYYRQLLRQAGHEEDEVRKRANGLFLYHTHALLYNLFSPGNPYTLRQRRAEIKRLIFDNPEMYTLFEHALFNPVAIVRPVQLLARRLNSPWLFTLHMQMRINMSPLVTWFKRLRRK